MSTINTRYLGLDLSSPIIVGSSNFTSKVESIVEAEAAGAGAVVLKSLFEEQIVSQAHSMSSRESYPEADDYLQYYTRTNSVDAYLDLIAGARKKVKIPVIASINCFSPKGWIDFALEIERAGASALEVNIFFIPTDKHENSTDSEKVYFRIIDNLKKKLKIPVSVKIGQKFSNILNFVWQMYNHGAAGVTMFNRFYEPDFDINNLNIVPASVLSNPAEQRYVLRWVGMVSAQDIKIDISASTGVYTGEDAIKYLLAGATTVQVCSALYKRGFTVVSEINETLARWMNNKEFRSISDFRGKLNYRNVDNPSLFERSQFMKHYSSYI
ncbi:MAG: dihydroorotate dehydrogenase-like protein [Bacteroidales bacterium]|jgi:dihydroorotate dehydrogenase (fumarate)|nr:dihydroorotate dehydrogenase-like protein [Bacteroidales bacterium]MDX9927230.1 dihydroorotate dehydrogenase-like protein [Bacteroidales bacterium]HNX83993.1 dihydroorotate dehydrogenase-like protein [Bacteroidales bacterium]HOC49160.1 dihydroorotate dehydrogenase-like protein [Bacteroidales bacterium]HPS97727.1 dihydroorotate dehydrogenase-like protein [Bacteroidales bacterium]